MHSDLKPDGLTMPGKELEFPIALLSHPKADIQKSMIYSCFRHKPDAQEFVASGKNRPITDSRLENELGLLY